MTYAKSEITYIQCGKTKLQSRHSAKGKYCSKRCQAEYQYATYIDRWLRGEETGRSGKSGLSGHVYRYVFEKYDSKCVLCGWNEKHPVDGSIPCDIDHIDGNWMNTTEGNLRLLCPCCHSLTPTYKARNRGKAHERTINISEGY